MTQAETVAFQGGEKVDGSRKKLIDEVVFYRETAVKTKNVVDRVQIKPKKQ